MPTVETYDTAVIGAGVFGAWTAFSLQQSGKRVALLDAYGAAGSRASSGGETRVIRMGYGADEIYTRWAMRSLTLWQEFFKGTGQPLFQRTGVLWMAHDEDAYVEAIERTLESCGVEIERLSRASLVERYPQIDFGSVTWAVFEPLSGVLLARRAVQALVSEALRGGVSYFNEAVVAPVGLTDNARLEFINTSGGRRVFADSFVFACGPWMAKLFPDLLGDLIHPTRQEVYFFGVPAGDRRFAPPLMPVWLDFHELIYTIPDIEGRGFKVAIDRHGPECDPDGMERVITAEGLKEVRDYLRLRVPALKDAPVLETRVCQYENTSNGDFLIDRHPAFANVWLVGGGSGHGFKHGPAVGEYVSAAVGGDVQPVEPRFALATKQNVRKRAVF
ncbi:MAG TPA: FAD-dependent oxidoreductase [Pyrinomonadaceae bacterium]|jgi:monomeric sarcosine oxidase